MGLPTTAKERKGYPITTGVLDYFPDAIAEIARVSKAGNDQHNPGEPLHWAREKSTDHADCISRHLLERGTLDTDGQRHSAKMAWRALALLQTELEVADAALTDSSIGDVAIHIHQGDPGDEHTSPSNPRPMCLASFAPGSVPSYTCNRVHGHDGPHQALDRESKILKEW